MSFMMFSLQTYSAFICFSRLCLIIELYKRPSLKRTAFCEIVDISSLKHLGVALCQYYLAVLNT